MSDEEELETKASRERVHKLEAPSALAEDQAGSQYLHGSSQLRSQLPITPVLGDPMSSSTSMGHYTHGIHTFTKVIYMYIIRMKGFFCCCFCF